VYAPSDQGKKFAAEILIHGKHGVHPTLTLKIDTTNMKHCCAEQLLNCPSAAESLALVLYEALSSSIAILEESGKATELGGGMACELRLPISIK
jgi:hypothetical protein